MRSKRVIFVCALALLTALAACPAHAGWEKILTDLSPNNLIVSGDPQSVKVYNATVNFTIIDHDSNPHNFSSADSINFALAGHPDLTFIGGTKPAFIQWTKDHSDALLRALFPSDPAQQIAGSSGPQFIASSVITDMAFQPGDRKMGCPTGVTVQNNDIVVREQYDYFSVGGVSVKGSSGVVGYVRTFSGSPDNQIGVLIPHRSATAKDGIGSKLYYAQPTFFFRHSFAFGQNGRVQMGADGFVGVNYFTSDLFPDGGGYLRYGGGPYLSASYLFFSRLILTAETAYQISKTTVPDNFIGDDLKFLTDAINNRAIDHDVTVGARADLALIPGSLWLTGNVFRVNSLGGSVESGFKYQTVVLGELAALLWNRVDLELGYKTSFEVKDYKDHSIIFRAGYKF
jgi:hypothetical protein